MTKSNILTVSDLANAENEHVGWMSTLEYYQEVWNLVLSDIPNKLIAPIVLIKTGKKGKSKKNLGFPILTQKQFDNLLKTQVMMYKTINPQPSVFVWPIGVLYRGNNAVHWNVFIVKKSSRKILRFDPSMSINNDPQYAYSKHIPKKIASAFKKDIVLVLPQKPCQVDIHGLDHFCQTWILFFTDFFLHNSDRKRLSAFKKFDFFNKGKPMLKSWLRCIYKQLHHGKKETWFDYAMTRFPALFHYQHPDTGLLKKAPILKGKKCWGVIFAKIK
jgi:hypothetical protein